MKYFLLCIALIGSFLYMPAQQTKLLTAEKHNEYGLVYTLPVTSFRVEIVAVKETKLAGPFSKYAKIFTSETDVISKDAVNWTIESVKVIPFGVPDSEKRYLMQLKPGATTYIGVSEDGMLLSVNKEPDFIPSESISGNELIGEKFNGKEYLDFVNEDFLAAQSSYKQAQILAEEIMEIRDSKISLTRGTAETMPTDGRQLEIMLASLEKQEQALTNAFTGSSWKERIVRTFTFTPDDDGEYIICRLNPTQGLIDASNTSGEPIKAFVTLVERAEMPVDSKGEEKKIPKDAVVYNIPGTANLVLELKGQSLFEKDFQMSQFGMTFGLNPSIFTDKKEPSYAIFDPATGALRELGSLK